MILLTTSIGNELCMIKYNLNRYNIVFECTFMDNKGSIWGSFGRFLSSKRVKFGTNAAIMENLDGSDVF